MQDQNILWDNGNIDLISDRIAEDLSSDSYAIVDGFFPATEAESIRMHMQDLRQKGNFKKAGIGAAHQFQVNTEIRADWIYWIDENESTAATKALIRQITRLMDHINRSCFLGLKGLELHYAIYPPGAYYKRHLDQFKSSSRRRLTILCYLNDNWSDENGGLLRIYLKSPFGEETFVDIAPLAGRLVCFRSDLIEHEVRLCSRERFSITGWMLDQPNDLGFL